MRKLFVLLSAAGFGCLSAFGAIDLKESKFTQVVNDVQIISTTDNARHAATVDGVFKMPDVLRTGAGSRAELVAADNTITRVGANTIFSFDAANRTIDLQQGSLLFNTPKGKGGGSIHTAAATAAVLGTTIIVTTTRDGGFKVLTLEGTAEVTFLKGLSQRLRAGQLIYVLPGSVPGPILNFRLDQQVRGSRLVNGFTKQLPSIGKISAQVSKQTKQIQSGHAQDTGLLAGNSATTTTVEAFNVVAVTQGGGPSVNTAPSIAAIATGSSGNNNNGNPGQIIASGGGFLNPDGFLFTPDGTTSADIANAMGAAQATLTDATISGSTLDPSRVFLAGLDITGNNISPDNTVGGNFSGDNGFFARNITFTTPTLDLSIYASMELPYFDIIASEDMTIANSLDISGVPGSGLYLTAGGQILVEPGVTLTTEAEILYLTSGGGISINSAQVINSMGLVGLASIGPIAINNSTITAGSLAQAFSGTSLTIYDSFVNGANIDLETAGTFSATTGGPNGLGAISGGSQVTLLSGTGMTIGMNVTADTETGSLLLENTSGLLTINNGASIQAANITIDSQDGVLIDSAAPPVGNMTISVGSSPGDVATIQNTSLANLSSLAISAYTVVLNNVNMSGQVNLTSFTGTLAANPNTGASMVPGDVNFIQNVTYQNQPAQNFIGSGINLHALAGP